MFKPNLIFAMTSAKRRILGLSLVTLTLSFMACLTAPNEPNSGPLVCPASQAPFNGACVQTCATTADCTGGLSCMVVGQGTAVCLNYAHCAYIQSDTTCERASGGGGYGGNGYGEYSSYDEDPYWMVSPDNSGELSYSYQGASCVGNATWVAIAPSGDPQCGQSHEVTRCRPTSHGCSLLNGTTEDIAEP